MVQGMLFEQGCALMGAHGSGFQVVDSDVVCIESQPNDSFALHTAIATATINSQFVSTICS
eukprot:SAG31_NODE_232_length_19710_cov_17.109581_2_plen_61_part_00